MARNVKDGVVNDYQLALISKSVFDIGPRVRALMLMAGMVGVALAFMASLDSGKQVPLDKIIHFSGYFTLSATFVLALRPILFVPGLIGIFAMSVAIEFLQCGEQALRTGGVEALDGDLAPVATEQPLVVRLAGALLEIPTGHEELGRLVVFGR